MKPIIKPLSVRVHDKTLNRMAFDVNRMWNATNKETSRWCYITIKKIWHIGDNISVFDL